MRCAMRSVFVIAGSAVAVGCGASNGGETVLREVPIADDDGVVSQVGVTFDTETTSDGNGSLKLVATQPTTFRLYEFENIDADDTRLIYRAQLRTENMTGQVYLEMWCGFDGLGEFFSRALHAPLTGTVDWTTQETPFFLERGQRPDRVRLNLVATGAGTIWIDRIVLAKAGS